MHALAQITHTHAPPPHIQHLLRRGFTFGLLAWHKAIIAHREALQVSMERRLLRTSFAALAAKRLRR